jgi:hypothetical protein
MLSGGDLTGTIGIPTVAKLRGAAIKNPLVLADKQLLKWSHTNQQLEPGFVDWLEVEGKPSTFTPSAHNHVMADVTDLDAVEEAPSDGTEYVRKNAGWVANSGGSGGATVFTDLTDVPAAYSGEGGNVVSVKLDESGLEFTTPGGATVSYPTRATMWHDESTVVTGNALTIVKDPAMSYYHYAYQNAAANGDTFTQSFVLASGTYTFSVLGYTNTNRGKVDWYIDDVLVVGDQNWHSAGPTGNVIKTSSVTVSSDGVHVLKGIAKLGDGGGYNLLLTKFWFKLASD